MNEALSDIGDVRKRRWPGVVVWLSAVPLILWSLLECHLMWSCLRAELGRCSEWQGMGQKWGGLLNAPPGGSPQYTYMLLAFVAPMILVPAIYLLAMHVKRPAWAILLGLAALAAIAWEWWGMALTLDAHFVDELWAYSSHRGDIWAAEPFAPWDNWGLVYLLWLPLCAILIPIRGGAGLLRSCRRRPRQAGSQVAGQGPDQNPSN